MALSGFNHTVRWSEFTQRRSRPQGEEEDAYIEVRYGYSYSSQRNQNAIAVSSAVVTIAVQSRNSWSVTNQQTTDLLAHEQGHYDITAIGARAFYNELLTLSAASANDLRQAASDLNDRYQQQINSVNDRYDTQTDHSQNTLQQQQWSRAIAAEKQNPNSSLSNLP